MIQIAAESTRIDRETFEVPRGGLQRIDELVPAVLARYRLIEPAAAAQSADRVLRPDRLRLCDHTPAR